MDNRNNVHSIKCPLCENDYKTITELCAHISKEYNMYVKKTFDSIHST